MEIVRIYNNNVIVTYDEDYVEAIAIGKGIGFQKKIGDIVELEAVEKIFTLKDKNIQSKLEELLLDMPSIYLEISEEIVKMIVENSVLQLNEDIYLTLTDHISVSLKREKEGVICNNPLLPEIKQFYKTEFELAQKASQVVEKYMNVKISEDEIGFITMHIVNASMNQQMQVTMKATRMVSGILGIVENFFGKKFDEKSTAYLRFVRHLQFFTRRLLNTEKSQESETYFYKWGKKEHTDVYKCVKEIGKYVENNMGRSITKGEKGYLILHIVNIVYS